MPTYEYQCRKCGHRFEVFQRIVDPPIRDCPKCKARGTVEQIISGGAGLIFKGSGFYETDYKRSTDRKPGPDRKGGADRKGGPATGNSGPSKDTGKSGSSVSKPDAHK